MVSQEWLRVQMWGLNVSEFDRSGIEAGESTPLRRDLGLRTRWGRKSELSRVNCSLYSLRERARAATSRGSSCVIDLWNPPSTGPSQKTQEQLSPTHAQTRRNVEELKQWVMLDLWVGWWGGGGSRGHAIKQKGIQSWENDLSCFILWCYVSNKPSSDSCLGL